MEPFRRVSGTAAPLLRSDVDTDAICPSRYKPKQLSKYGFEDALFAAWRFDEHGTELPDFVLNQDPYRNASILVAGANFGCGSSRETAVWALRDFGIRAVIAPSFASIFETNCVRNGLLPLPLPYEAHERFVDDTFIEGAAPAATIDLEACLLTATRGTRFPFSIEPQYRDQLSTGLDSVGATLLQAPLIERFREEDREARPWVYSSRR
jgi:3-isopropylmalate/(R)-2-methylmalate dehydratase small subunit